MTPARRAIRFEDPVAPAPLPAPSSRAYRLGYRVGSALPSVGWWGLVCCGGPLTLYLLPAVWAYARRHPHRRGILLWTALLGWTGTGWVAAWLYVWWVR